MPLPGTIWGKAYVDSGNLDAAIACFKEVSENLLYATPHYPMLNLGEAYYIKKEYKTAETYFQKALNHYRDGYPKDATYVKALRGLGRARLATGNIKDGIAALERAIRLAPRFEPLYLDLAAAYEMQREYEKALNIYRRLIRMAPDGRFSEQAVKAADQLKKQMGN